MSNPTETYLDSLKPILNVVDELIDNWYNQKTGKCLQLPDLLGRVAVQFNWDEEQVRNHDPIIRSYVRQHPTWYITRGAGGGIMLRAEWQKKEDAKSAKEAAKANIKAAVAAKLMPQPTPPPTPPQDVAEDNANIDPQQ